MAARSALRTALYSVCLFVALLGVASAAWSHPPTGDSSTHQHPHPAPDIRSHVREVEDPISSSSLAVRPIFPPGQRLRIAVPPGPRQAENGLARLFRAPADGAPGLGLVVVTLVAALLAGAAAGRRVPVTNPEVTAGDGHRQELAETLANTLIQSSAMAVFGFLAIRWLRWLPVGTLSTWVSLFSGFLVVMMGCAVFQRALVSRRTPRVTSDGHGVGFEALSILLIAIQMRQLVLGLSLILVFCVTRGLAQFAWRLHSARPAVEGATATRSGIAAGLITTAYGAVITLVGGLLTFGSLQQARLL